MVIFFNMVMVIMVLLSVLGAVIFLGSWAESGEGSSSSSYECGFDKGLFVRSPFSLRFFILTVIFLVFDVELVLLLPSVFLFLDFFSFSGLAGVGSFLLILYLGTIYEMSQGSLSWVCSAHT
uniref:NADH-ubiquinone oxidoreductase chain 3 n=1 Tax=Laevipilina antarctica TaxID=358449 RepID=A0A1L6BZY1_9MOLL|nr:NADH dehydrogenase subunit 3 [Laevipilina antarctica]APQ42956.1 NADH dehydrogenase subunit 3 [Laevipilina antarctica]